MTDIFLSYDDEDRPRARALVAALEDRGLSIFWDRSIPAGKTWWQAIGLALAGARTVVVLWSRTAVQSTWVYEEAEAGRKRGILIPVFIDPVLPPIGLRSVQAVDLCGWDGSKSDPAFEKLLMDIGALIAAGAETVEQATTREPGESREADEDLRNEPEDVDEEEPYHDDDEYSSSRFYLLLGGLILGCVMGLYLWG